MPLITINVNSDEQGIFLSKIIEELRIFAAKKLSCNGRILNKNEISIRVSKSIISKSIADIELTIMAYSYAERIDNQDKICLQFKEFLEEKSKEKFTFFIWLQLSELGHSVEE
ncbi:MAG: hypothetical protein VXZ40_04615 [Nanoarchaeota archaeon]|nr:hypothetical protein [Nanoarchaeota archaeon]